jgi:hypothetical protein
LLFIWRNVYYLAAGFYMICWVFRATSLVNKIGGKKCCYNLRKWVRASN